MTGTNRKANIRRRRKPKKLAAIKRIRLTDEQWTEISRHVALESEAQWMIEEVINFYRKKQADIDAQKAPANLRKELDHLRDDLKSFIARLAKLFFYDADFYSAAILQPSPARGRRPRTGPALREVNEQRTISALHQLQSLSDWLVLARESVPRGRSTRQSLPAYIAAERLDEILAKFKKKHLTRSTKLDDTYRYVRTVLRIADPDIRNGTIVGAMRRQIKGGKIRGKIALDKPAAIPPQKSRDKRPTSRKTTNRCFEAK
jgi:hypothetical protein